GCAALPARSPRGRGESWRRTSRSPTAAQGPAAPACAEARRRPPAASPSGSAPGRPPPRRRRSRAAAPRPAPCLVGWSDPAFHLENKDLLPRFTDRTYPVASQPGGLEGSSPPRILVSARSGRPGTLWVSPGSGGKTFLWERPGTLWVSLPNPHRVTPVTE